MLSWSVAWLRLLAVIVLAECLSCPIVWGEASPSSHRLKQLNVDPTELAPACELKWNVNPVELSTSTSKDREFVETLTSFWFGGPLKTEILDGGMSNVYSTADGDFGVVVLSLLFKDEATATKLAAALKAAYDPAGPNVFQSYGKILIICSNSAGVSEECFELIRSTIGKRAAALNSADQAR